ncbi:MAG: hypothetical protein WDA22_15480 [Bacteroidota bacterium]
MITKIESFLKMKEPKGLLRFGFRRGGKLDIDWKKEKAPETQVSSAFIGWLREKHEESNFLKFEIPVVLVKICKGAQHIFIDHKRLPYYLNLHNSDMIALRVAGLIHPEVPDKIS